MFLLLTCFVMTFKYSSLVKASVLDSMNLFITSIVPSMLPAYFLIDLLINYGLLNAIYKLFKNNTVLLFLISLISGTPTNAKYIKEFYSDGYISLDDANFLLLFSYSPNPLFILAFSPDVQSFFLIVLYLYATNFLIYLFFRRKFKRQKDKPKTHRQQSFIDCLSSSITKSFNVLLMILGVIVFYGLVNSLLDILGISSFFLASALELTNALHLLTAKGASLLWFIFAITFGGLSIHTQIKSILENSNISYRHFLIGRLIASLPILFIALFY